MKVKTLTKVQHPVTGEIVDKGKEISIPDSAVDGLVKINAVEVITQSTNTQPDPPAGNPAKK